MSKFQTPTLNNLEVINTTFVGDERLVLSLEKNCIKSEYKFAISTTFASK